MDPSMTAEEEAPKDPGAFKPHASVTDNEILGESAFPFPLNMWSLYQKFVKTLQAKIKLQNYWGKKSPSQLKIRFAQGNLWSNTESLWEIFLKLVPPF